MLYTSYVATLAVGRSQLVSLSQLTAVCLFVVALMIDWSTVEGFDL